MPCTAKKIEARRPQLAKDGVPDTDLVLTVRELARLFKSRGIDLKEIDDGEFDTPFMSQGSGAGVISVRAAVWQKRPQERFTMSSREKR